MRRRCVSTIVATYQLASRGPGDQLYSHQHGLRARAAARSHFRTATSRAVTFGLRDAAGQRATIALGTWSVHLLLLAAVMQIMACVNEESIGDLLRLVGREVKWTRTLDPVVIATLLARGELSAVVVDPRAVSIGLLRRTTTAASVTDTRVMLWTTLSPASIPAIISANDMSCADLLIRGAEESTQLLHQYLRERDYLSIRAVAINYLSPFLWRVPLDVAAHVLTILTFPVSGLSLAQLIQRLRIPRRRLERKLRRAHFCGVNALRHLGRILVAFERVAHRRERIEMVATTVGYVDGADLRLHCRRLVQCVPSAFGTRLDAHELAARIVRTITSAPVAPSVGDPATSRSPFPIASEHTHEVGRRPITRR